MTWKELLGLDADGWEKLTDAELIATLEPYFKVTRPELGRKSEEDIGKAFAKEKKSGKQRDKNQLTFLDSQKELIRQATLAGIVLPNLPKPPS